ncbi:translation initiation factor IF-2 [Aquirufa ecclesiirivi]|uniref:translation initiation factor IF-2 n=1 Tax=Aquirufa ecclesiirivi TaxID=2715124 RepID=UPI003BAFC4E9
MAEEKTMRLSLVAKQINVGTSTILQFLSAKGHKIDNNPNAKLNFEQLSLLAREYDANHILEASEAPKKVVEEVVVPEPVVVVEKKPEPAPVVEVVAPTPEPVPVIEVPVVEVAKPEPKQEEEPRPMGLKVLGRIDLDKKGHPITPKPVEKQAEAPKVVEEKVVEPVAPVVPEAKVEPIQEALEPVKEEVKPVVVPVAPVVPPVVESTSPPDIELIEAKGETLKGLTVLGKIELPTPSDRSGDKKHKRKRIIKEEKRPVSNDTTNRPAPAGGGGDFKKKDFGKKPATPGAKPGGPKEELSDKDIQEQIKATMARLQGATNKQSFGADKRRVKRRERAEADEARQLAEDEESKILKVTEFISASDLASLMDVSVNEVISTCMSLGMFVSINQRLDAEAITIIADEFGFEVSFISAEEEIDAVEIEVEDDPADLVPRAPIVTIMGHVDHGKTSLLDYIRRAKVAAGEAGGITQHIGAYSVQTESGKKVTFLDTPGHEAFTAMRARGAKITDVVIIVIAADDSVMPQTKEAINHAMVAGVPIVFAFSKVDKDGANPDKVREELAAMNMLVEDWGGKYQCQEISSKSGLGIDDLLEKVLLEAELLDLKANPNKKAIGSVIEAELDKGRGYVTTLLIQSGTLNIGDMMLAGDNYGRVKAMFDHHGNKIKKAGPSTPVQVLGLNGAPQAGDKLLCLENEREAREIANKREQILREQSLRTRKHITLEEIGRRKAIGTFRELNVIVKGDVDGSVEALSDSLLKLSTEEVQVRIIHKGVGQVSESDVALASTSDAVIIAFQVRPSVNARKLAEAEQIEIRNYSIIYQAIDEIKAAMEGMLAPTFEEVITSNIEVRDVFKISKIGTVAGCYVLDGTVKRANKIRVIRDFVVVHEGEISALKRFKDDVAEVKFGYECGLSVKNFNDLEVGDTIECYEMKEVKRTLK